LNGLTSNSGTILNSTIKKINENPEQGDLVYSESFNGNLINSVIRSSGIIFENEDLTSFGATVARDFDKPCMVKTKISRINSEELTTQPELEDEPEFSDDDLERIRDLLSELENELIELNMRYSSERQSGKKVDNDKAKIVSDLEWQIREVRTKINQNQQ
jgi:phosphohistidine swiveling domain-containing protein